MRSVSVRGGTVRVTDDPHRVLTQLLSCLLEHASLNAAEESRQSDTELL